MRPDQLLDGGLPFNRKERFFTGTIFPALAMDGDIARLGRFLGALGFDAELPYWTDAEANIQVFTEYGIAESLPKHHPLASLSLPRDTPDLVIYQPGVLLLGVEAKMFDRPSAAELSGQVERQRMVLEPLAEHLGVKQVHQVLLLPSQLVQGLGHLPEGVPVFSWEALLDLYQDGPPWARDVLRHALAGWDDFAGKTKGAGADEFLSGEQIKRLADSGTLTEAVVGRNKGLNGAAFTSDVQLGGWRSWLYQVRYQSQPPNANWFTLAEFVDRVGHQGEVPYATAVLISWQIARDVIRTYGDAVTLVELHPGGGQYDVLALMATGGRRTPRGRGFS